VRRRPPFAAMLLDGVGHAVGEHHGLFAADDLVEGDQLLRADERAGAVVDEDVGDVGRQHREGLHHRILPLAAAADEDGGRRRVGGEFHHLALVAVDDDVEVGDTALDESGGGVGEHGPAVRGGEDLVAHDALHAAAAAGGEEDGGGAGHRSWESDYRWGGRIWDW
jgi:hypothetical protein